MQSRAIKDEGTTTDLRGIIAGDDRRGSALVPGGNTFPRGMARAKGVAAHAAKWDAPRVDPAPRHPACRSRKAVAVRGAVALVWMLIASVAMAAPAGAARNKGMDLARKKRCPEAVPLLEQAELEDHRPTTTMALAGCYIATGEFFKARDMLTSLAGEDLRKWPQYWERRAIQDAAKKLDALERRIPTVDLRPAKDYPELQVFLGGKEVPIDDSPYVLPPFQRTTVTVRAKGYREYSETFEPGEGEHLVLRVVLQSLTSGEDAPRKRPPPASPPATWWFGGGFQGYLIPRQMWHLLGDGGRTAYVPSGRLTLSSLSESGQLTLGLGWIRLGISPTPLKPNGNPDTDYEIIESSLHGPLATIEWHWLFALSNTWKFRLGAGAGVGFFAFGSLYRTQAFPMSLSPSDPGDYRKCIGPNNPAGTYRYCNQLRDDDDHYGGYKEPGWTKGGRRPDVFPWVALPELGVSWSASKSFVLDLDFGLSIGGMMVALTGRTKM